MNTTFLLLFFPILDALIKTHLTYNALDFTSRFIHYHLKVYKAGINTIRIWKNSLNSTEVVFELLKIF